MRESDRLPEHLRARLARALDAVPEPGPRPDQAVYARSARRGTRHRPALALASGAAAVAALLGLTGVASTGSPSPAVWTGRALSAIQPAPPAAAPTPSHGTPPPSAPGSTATPPRASPTAQAARPPIRPGEAVRPTIPPGLLTPPAGQLPRFSPPPFPTGYPFPTPSGTSDFGHGGR
jgi:hypothetical protein